jgi:hypothetical protein
MKTFLVTLVALYALDIFGKAVLLYLRSTTRTLESTAIDLFINIVLLVWAARLLAQ